MTRSEIIETMARANWKLAHDEPCKDWQIAETAAELAAYEAAGLAVVPVEASKAICEAIVETAEIYDEWGVDKHVSNSDAVYEAAIKAAQGAHKP
jgi:hypothetical protein